MPGANVMLIVQLFVMGGRGPSRQAEDRSWQRLDQVCWVRGLEH
jgi:hypothetical protein